MLEEEERAKSPEGKGKEILVPVGDVNRCGTCLPGGKHRSGRLFYQVYVVILSPCAPGVI